MANTNENTTTTTTIPLVGNKAPEFTVTGVQNGQFNEYTLPNTNGRWTLLLFYPLDFTFVCPTEIIAFSNRTAEFKELGVDVYGISVDSQFSHLAWTETERKNGGVGNLEYPLLADINKNVSNDYGVLTGGVALRGMYLIDDEGIIQHATINNLAVGRSVDETLRLVQAFQTTKKTGEVCPADWTPSADTMQADPSGLKAYAKKHN